MSTKLDHCEALCGGAGRGGAALRSSNALNMTPGGLPALPSSPRDPASELSSCMPQQITGAVLRGAWSIPALPGPVGLNAQARVPTRSKMQTSGTKITSEIQGRNGQCTIVEHGQNTL